MTIPSLLWAPEVELSPLADGFADVWAAPLEHPSERLAAFAKTLSPDETVRAERFSTAPLRDAFVAGRGLVRDILSRYCDVPAKAIAFEYGERGKPSLSGANGALKFNASHSCGVLLFAISRDAEVGVDVERVVPRPDLTKLARRFFAPDEANVLDALSPDDRLDAFYACWTRKEAYLKARGGGLHLPLDKFVVSFSPGADVELISSEIEPDDPALFSLTELSPAQDFVGALAVARKKATARRIRWTPRLD
jgi:4'-phosphopantetheinyl transferase